MHAYLIFPHFPPHFLHSSLPAAQAKAPATACLPVIAPQHVPDGWLLLAALVVCAAGRLAAQRRG